MFRVKTAINIFRATWAYILGKKINQVQLSFGTVGWDDIRIAFSYLLYPHRNSELQIVREYELAFSTYNGSSYAFSFLQGRVALSACLRALELKQGDKIVIPAYTCIAVVNACWIHKLDIEFCDIELDTFGLSFDDFRMVMERCPDVKAVVVQHLFGLVSRDFQQIIAYCRERSVFVIEDCAHSTGASYNARKIGNYGDVAFFSSEQSKVLNTLIGGVAITNDEEIAAKIARFQEHCLPLETKECRALLAHFIDNYFRLKHRYRVVLGPIVGILFRFMKRGKVFTGERICKNAPDRYFCALPACLAAIGINQLKQLPKFVRMRRLEAKRWEEWCRSKALKLPMVIQNSQPVFLRYPVLVDPGMKRDRTWANSLHVQVGVWFVSYLHPVEYQISGCPNAKKAIESCINFPTLSF